VPRPVPNDIAEKQELLAVRDFLTALDRTTRRLGDDSSSRRRVARSRTTVRARRDDRP
jgi:hypothetical protein